MKEQARALTFEIVGRETLMEGADMRALMLTLASRQRVEWHYHSIITDVIICLEGPMVVETRAASHVLQPTERYTVLPNTPHSVHGLYNGPCRYLILQGVGDYDNVAVGN